jgi:hypothetical protein
LYQFKDEIDLDGHFWFDKKLIENYNWAILQKASKSVYPVICSFMNDQGLAFPGERTIACLAGRTDATTRKGLNGLQGLPNFKLLKYKTKTGNWSKRFEIEKPNGEQGSSFPVFKQIFEGGNWGMATPTGQALYIVMLAFSKADDEELLVQCDEHDVGFIDAFRKREYGICELDGYTLAEYAGITRRSINPALENLQSVSLLDIYDANSWKVYLRPPSIYKRAFLNKHLMKKYRYELNRTN